MEKIQKLRQMLKLQADYEQFMESVSEDELNEDELELVAAAGASPQYQKFFDKYIRKEN